MEMLYICMKILAFNINFEIYLIVDHLSTFFYINIITDKSICFLLNLQRIVTIIDTKKYIISIDYINMTVIYHK